MGKLKETVKPKTTTDWATTSDRQRFIVQEFRKGRSIKGISETIYYEIKTTDKKFTQKEARTEVEKAILIDYLKEIKKSGGEKDVI